jgi:prevent-host-death family protein
MSRRYSVAEAKNQLPALVHAAEEGEPIEITRHGEPVAVVLSIAEYQLLRRNSPDLMERYRAWRERWKDVPMTDEEIDEIFLRRDNDEPSRKVEW